MDKVVRFRQMIDACCFIVGYMGELQLSDSAQLQVMDVLQHVCVRADELERKAIDKMFLPKDSE